MITFYPGPSKVYSEVPNYVRDAYDAGVLSINHRSPEFMKIYRRTIQLVKEKLDVPESYTVLFSSSATECWEIICQSLITKKSFHVYNGAFGEKWLRYAKHLVPTTGSLAFMAENLPEMNSIQTGDSELIALTHNETSNGTALPSEWMQELRKRFPENLMAVDATSSMAGVELPWQIADVWFASVQKCFGLPAGLAVLVLSPQAIVQAQQINDRKYYNSLLNIFEQGQRNQTTHTPNVLGIYLLMRVLEDRDPIRLISATTIERYNEWKKMLTNLTYVNQLFQNWQIHSKTVIPIWAEPHVIAQLHHQSQANGITLGKGYGAHKQTTLRIANFPAITDTEIHQLMDFFANFAPDTTSR